MNSGFIRPIILKSISSPSWARNLSLSVGWEMRREVVGREEEEDQGQQESPPEVCWVIINGKRLQLAADISYSKRSASHRSLHLLI